MLKVFNSIRDGKLVTERKIELEEAWTYEG